MRNRINLCVLSDENEARKPYPVSTESGSDLQDLNSDFEYSSSAFALVRRYSAYILHVLRPSLVRFLNASKPALLQKFEPCQYNNTCTTL